MRPGNPLGDHAQRAVRLPVILKPAVANEDGVGVSSPLTDQCRTGLQRGGRIEARATVSTLSCQSQQAATQCPAGSAKALLLQLVSEGPDEQIAAEPVGLCDTMQLAPGKAQLLCRSIE